MRKGIILALGILVTALDVSAQAAEPQALTIEAENITAQSDARAGSSGASTLPGDVIEYRLTFTNHQDGPVSDVVLNDPIPEGVVFVPGSVTGSRADLLIEYSIDDGASWSERPQVDVDVAGRTERQPAPAPVRPHPRWAGPASAPTRRPSLARARPA